MAFRSMEFASATWHGHPPPLSPSQSIGSQEEPHQREGNGTGRSPQVLEFQYPDAVQHKNQISPSTSTSSLAANGHLAGLSGQVPEAHSSSSNNSIPMAGHVDPVISFPTQIKRETPPIQNGHYRSRSDDGVNFYRFDHDVNFGGIELSQVPAYVLNAVGERWDSGSRFPAGGQCGVESRPSSPSYLTETRLDSDNQYEVAQLREMLRFRGRQYEQRYRDRQKAEFELIRRLILQLPARYRCAIDLETRTNNSNTPVNKSKILEAAIYALQTLALETSVSN